jgi:2-polyprenylphenol 6-hydroxylase
MKLKLANPDCDVAVVGGGVVGLTAALLFADAGYRVCIIEPQRDDAPPNGPIGLRTYALTPAARALLEAVGAWNRMAADRIGQFSRMAVVDAESSGRIAFEVPVTEPGAMGYIVEHQALIAALLATLGQRRVTWHRQKLETYTATPAPLLVLEDGRRVTTLLAVGADGAHSRLRELAGIAHQAEPYVQSAVVCNIVTELRHDEVARQRFLADGPIAFLPLADPHACAVVWTMTPQAATSFVEASAGVRAAAISAASDHVLGAATAVSESLSFALERSAAQNYFNGSAVLVGDAAHVIHPLAGQGLNLGLMDAAALIECLSPRHQREQWPVPAALRRYQRWRRSEAAAMTLVTDGLHHLFRQRLAPLRMLRGLGLRATDRFGPLKSWLIARAMGLEGDLPELARIARADKRD